MASNSASRGRGPSLGEISPERIFCRTFAHVSRFSSTDDGVPSAFKFRPPDIIRSLWQSVHEALRTGFTAWLNAAASVGVTGFGGAAAHKVVAHRVAAAARPRKRIRRSKESLRFNCDYTIQIGRASCRERV